MQVPKRRRSPYVAHSHLISHLSLLPSQPSNILSVSPSTCSPEIRTTKGNTAASHPNHGSVTISLPFVLPSPTMLGFLRFPASSAHVALQIDFISLKSKPDSRPAVWLSVGYSAYPSLCPFVTEICYVRIESHPIVSSSCNQAPKIQGSMVAGQS